MEGANAVYQGWGWSIYILGKRGKKKSTSSWMMVSSRQTAVCPRKQVQEIDLRCGALIDICKSTTALVDYLLSFPPCFPFGIIFNSFLPLARARHRSYF